MHSEILLTRFMKTDNKPSGSRHHYTTFPSSPVGQCQPPPVGVLPGGIRSRPWPLIASFIFLKLYFFRQPLSIEAMWKFVAPDGRCISFFPTVR